MPYPLYITLFVSILIVTACGASDEERPEQNVNPGQAGDPVRLIGGNADLPEAGWEPRYEHEIRGAYVQINPALFQNGLPGEGAKLVLNLFEDTAYEAEITRVRRPIEGVTSMTGRIASEPDAWFTLSVEGERILASFRFPRSGKQYTIYYSEDPGCHVVAEVDPEKLDILPGDPPPTPPDTL